MTVSTFSSSANEIGGCPSLSYRWIGDFELRTPLNLPNYFSDNTPSSSSAVHILNEIYEAETVNGFIKKLVNGSKDLAPEVYKFVNENFWGLL
jgi:hypothetical protein